MGLIKDINTYKSFYGTLWHSVTPDGLDCFPSNHIPSSIKDSNILASIPYSFLSLVAHCAFSSEEPDLGPHLATYLHAKMSNEGMFSQKYAVYWNSNAKNKNRRKDWERRREVFTSKFLKKLSQNLEQIVFWRFGLL